MNIRDDLRFICSTTDSSLRYAESKHAAFIAFNGMATFGGFGMIRNLSLDHGGTLVIVILGASICLLICSIITGIYSFVPIILHKTEAGAEPLKDNALFFEHIKGHSMESYERLLCEKYGACPENVSALDRCIMSQIIVNARLASRKFTLFKRVAMFDLAAVAFALSGAALALLFQ